MSRKQTPMPKNDKVDRGSPTPGKGQEPHRGKREDPRTAPFKASDRANVPVRDSRPEDIDLGPSPQPRRLLRHGNREVEAYFDRTDAGVSDDPETLTVFLEDEDEAGEESEPLHQQSLTAITADALASGLAPHGEDFQEIPGADARLQAGDPEVDPLANEYSGEEVPGATTPTPDQNNVDDIGRLYGVSDEDNGSLVMGEELLKRRDEHRWELDPRSRKTR